MDNSAVARASGTRSVYAMRRHHAHAWARACAWCAPLGVRNGRVPPCGASTRCAARADDADGRAETAMRGVAKHMSTRTGRI
eukprot:3059851-Heterocapsa_arctica.AAC.2